MLGQSSDAETDQGHAQPPRALWVLAPLAVIAMAIAMRAAVSFSASFPPGIDAAYYPLQARSLLESGRLAYHDVPVIFVIDAALAQLLMLASSMDIDAATLLASRLVDCVSQPFAAIPIVALGLAWAGQTRRTWGLLAGITAAALLATVSLPMLRMTSDFEKNSLGLVWLAGVAWATNDAIARASPRRWAVLALMVALAALTHVAVFGAGVVLVGVALLARLMAHLRTKQRPSLPRLLLGGAACVAILAGSLLAIYVASPRRAATLLEAPIKLFQKQDRALGAGAERTPPNRVDTGRDGPPELGPGFGPDGGPPDYGPMGGPPDFGAGDDGPPDPFAGDGPPDFEDRPPPARAMRDGSDGSDGPNLRGGPTGGAGGPGGPRPHNDPLPPTIILVVNLIAIASLWRLWRDRANVALSQRCVVLGAAATSFVLACPLLSGDYFMRFALMAPIPASILLAFIFVRRSARVRSNWPALVISAASIATVLVGLGIVSFPANGPQDRPRLSVDGDTQRRDLALPPSPSLGAANVVVNEAQAKELRAMRDLIDDPARTVVLARHGLQWWAGFLMRVPVREDRVSVDTLEKYDRVLVLVESRGGGPDGRGPLQGPRQAIPRGGKLVYSGANFRLYETRRN